MPVIMPVIMPAIPALGRWWQADGEFKADMNCIVRFEVSLGYTGDLA